MLEKLLLLLFAGGLAASQLIPSSGEMVETFEKGQKLFVIENFEAAAEEYEAILDIQSPFLSEDSVYIQLSDELFIPVPLAATYQLGNCYKNLGDTDDALSYFRLVAGNAQSPELAKLAQYQIMLVYYNAGDYEATISEAGLLVMRYDDSVYVEKALYNTGWSYYELERYDKAVEAFQNQLIVAPAGEYAPRAQYQIGQSYFESERYEEAIDNYRAVIDNYTPKEFSERDWSDMELTKLRKRRQVESGTGLGYEENNIIELSAKAHLQMGDCYVRMDSVDLAVAEYLKVPEKYLPLSDLVETSFLKIAEAVLARDGIEGANQIYRDAMDNSESRVFQGKMQYQIATLNFEYEEYENAIAEYQLYIQGFSEIGTEIGFTADEAIYQIALAHFELRDYLASLSAYQQLLDDYPQSPIAVQSIFGMALCYQRLERYDEAIASLATIIDDHPNSPQVAGAHLQIARIEYDRQNYSGAIQAFQGVLDKIDENSEIDSNVVWFELGICYRDTEEYDSAIASFEKAWGLPLE